MTTKKRSLARAAKEAPPPKAPSCAPRPSARVEAHPAWAAHVRSAGSPLASDARLVLPPSLQYAIRAARVRTDDAAAARASALGARAYTEGSQIGFAKGAHAPDTEEGRALLAHEVGHVAEHLATGSTTLQRAPDPKAPAAPAPFYKSLEDELNGLKPIFQMPSGLFGHDQYAAQRKEVLTPLVALAKAVDQQLKADVPGLVTAYLAKAPTSGPVPTMSDDMSNELAVRVFLMGLPEDAEKLRRRHGTQVASATIFDEKSNRRVLTFWRDVAARTLASADTSTPAGATASIDALTRAFTGAREVLLRIDAAAVAQSRQFDEPRVRVYQRVFLYEVYDGLREILSSLFQGLMGSFQALEDAAVAELQAGTGKDALLASARSALETKIIPAIAPPSAKGVEDTMTQVTKSTFTKGKGRHRDFFLEGKAGEKRQIGFSLYDAKISEAPEMEMSYDRVLTLRRQRLAVLAELYGGHDATGKVTATSKGNAAAISALPGGLALHDNDAWRRFAEQRFDDLTKQGTSRGDALTAVVKTLQMYFQTFTIHTPYNLEDITQDSYLDRPFPRAMTGQLIHDCGVYALRTAYILSGLRGKLGLRFRYVVMPVHVGLVITGDGLPMYSAQNDHISVLTFETVASIRAGWEAWKTKKPNPKDPTAEIPAEPEGKKDDSQFVGELASQDFIAGPLDMPFVVFDVPDFKGKPAEVRAKLWAHYQKITTTDVFGATSKKPGNPDYQAHLRYLEITTRRKIIYNTLLVPFWNVEAPARYAALAAGLGVAPAKPAPLSGREAAKLLRDYVADVRKLMKPRDVAEESVVAQEKIVSGYMRAEPALTAESARLSYGARIASVVSYEWQVDLRNHLAKVTKLADTVETQTTVAPASIAGDIKPPFPPAGPRREPLD